MLKRLFYGLVFLFSVNSPALNGEQFITFDARKQPYLFAGSLVIAGAAYQIHKHWNDAWSQKMGTFFDLFSKSRPGLPLDGYVSGSDSTWTVPVFALLVFSVAALKQYLKKKSPSDLHDQERFDAIRKMGGTVYWERGSEGPFVGDHEGGRVYGCLEQLG